MTTVAASAVTLVAEEYPPRDRAVRPAGGALAEGPQSISAPIQATHTEPLKHNAEAFSSAKALPLPSARSSTSAGERPSSGPHTFGAIVTVIVSLSIVLGLFGACAWLMRRGLPNTGRTLPADAVSVLGRAPLAGRQQMHLIRFGNKMLLVCVSPAGVDSLGEISDPAEIDRLAALCEQQQTTSATAAFKQIFNQIAGDRSPAKWFAPKSAAAKEAADV